MKKKNKSLQFLIFEEIIDKIVVDTQLKLLSILDIDPESLPMHEKDTDIIAAADFVWSQRVIRIQMKDNQIIVMDREFDLANPKTFENITMFIRELQKDPRMLPRYAPHPENSR